MSTRPEFPFPHHKLDAYRCALELLEGAHAVAARIPRGHRALADQLLRASTSVVLNIGEGANRYTAGEKRASFSRARGECGEVAVAVEITRTLGWTPAAESARLLHRVGAMPTRLVQRNAS